MTTPTTEAPLCFARPVPRRVITPVDRRRYPKTGGMVDHPYVKELRTLKEDVLMLTTKEIIDELKLLVKTRKLSAKLITSQQLQSYIQGYVMDMARVKETIATLQLLVEHREKEGMVFKCDFRTLVHRWMADLNIDSSMTTTESPLRTLATAIDKNYSVLYRWYHENRFPGSGKETVRLNEIVLAASAKLKAKAHKAEMAMH